MTRILVVEDDLALSEDVVDWLTTSEKFTVESIADGLAAWQRLQSGVFDLVVLDIDLPGMNGMEICRCLRQSGNSTPVLMLTGRDKIDDKEAGFDTGADDYLTKPFHLKELSSRIKAILRRASRPADGSDLSLADHDPLIGCRIGENYQIVELVASGGMGVVYKAQHKLIGRPAAVKVLTSSLCRDRLSMLRFQREAEILSRLKHPNLIALYDFGVAADGSPYMVTEFVSGMTLMHVLNEEVELSAERASAIFKQICSGLRHAHENGLIHRDLKPSNIMLEISGGEREVVKLLDFGLAKVMPGSDEHLAELTQSGEYFGTPFYMSPEQSRGRDIDVRSDLYALGCIMYEVLTGLPPLRGANPLDTMQMQIHDLPQSMSQARPDLEFPDALTKIVMKLLAKEPGDRFQSTEELEAELICFTG